jgi:transposase-like protein
MTTTIPCPGCGSAKVSDRGGVHRQCGLCGWKFEVTSTGTTTSMFQRWMATKAKRPYRVAPPKRGRRKAAATVKRHGPEAAAECVSATTNREQR